ncbi:toll/interleukin-1 receptor domain-containing protein [Micrococcus luteus]|uniref:toll/interleukin-1 receptor domain-containing protein n=1 Tax=Micrococcus luteus TaxID=1270 RepID=UPI001CA6E938|nr:toll/interleukin-1 receptor domain-containing protein [Micrococcus luteus]QZY84245.1 toll/interleukin-1 receptor domain-containing protein [Micrococcus luteus]
MSVAPSHHVFISYVREDTEAVDELCQMLSAADIPYWRDLTSLAPGDEWKVKIRQAIQSDQAVAFLACFSAQSAARPVNNMNEELTLAIEEFRRHAPGHAWLFPIRLDETPVPEWELGINRTLNNLNWTDLFGNRKMHNYVQLTNRLHQLMGSQAHTPETVQAALENLSEADRTERLSQETKAMLLDPQRRIALSDLVQNETSRLLALLSDPEPYRSIAKREDGLVHAAQEIQRLTRATQPFCASLIVAARFGEPSQLEPWTSGMRSLTQAAVADMEGPTPLTTLRHIPAVMAIMSAGITAVTYQAYPALRRLVSDPRVQDRHMEIPLPLVAATDPWWPFAGSQTHLIAEMGARHIRGEAEPANTLQNWDGPQGYAKLKNPASEWLYAALRPLFAASVPEKATFDQYFQDAEVLLNALALDSDPRFRDGQQYHIRPSWTGLAAVYDRYRSPGANPAAQLAQQAAVEGAEWGPVRSGLFGSSAERARKATEASLEAFTRASTSHAFS